MRSRRVTGGTDRAQLEAVRWLSVLLLVVLAGCPSDPGVQGNSSDAESGDDGDFGDPAPTAPRSTCRTDDECRPAAATCCECPTFAVNEDDPLYLACVDVTCDSAPTCSATSAVCGPSGTCELACEPVTCDVSFVGGYATDAAGCLTCAAAVPAGECTADVECVQTRADCCGCAAGGADTAVPASTLSGFDDMLGCDGDIACPGVDVCEADAAPTCTQGRCALLASAPPAGACGDSNPLCPAGQVCMLNLDPDATVRGLGVCVPE